MSYEQNITAVLSRYLKELSAPSNNIMRVRFAKKMIDRECDDFRTRLFNDLAEYPPFSALRRWMCRGVSASIPASHAISDWIIAEFIKGTSIPVIYAEVYDAIQRNNSNYLEVTVIRGVSISERISVDDDTWLAPNELIEGNLARSIFVDRFGPYATSNSNAGAIVQRVRVGRVLAPYTDDVNDPFERSRGLESIDRSERRRRLRRALLLATDSPVVLSTTFKIPEKEGPLSVEQGGWSPSRDVSFGEREAVRPSEFRRVAALLQDFNGVASMNLAIDRLGAARESGDLTNKIIELGTALEVAFTYGDGGGRNQEIRYKLRTRAGWFLGTDSATRIEQGKIAAKLYDERSSAVHTGRLTEHPPMRER